MSTPAFRLRLPCIPYVPAIEGSLISSCSLHPPPGPCFIPPVPPPPPPSFGCYELSVETTTIAVGTAFALTASISYPKRAETGVCQPVINLQLKLPKGGSGGGGSTSSGSSSSSGGPSPGPATGYVRFALLADVVCNETYCTITKYFKNFDYNTETHLVSWV